MRKSLFVLICLLQGLLLTAQELPDISISEKFDNTSLTQVIRLLKNKYDIKIAYDDALVTGITINGTYNNKNLIDFLDEVLPPKGISYQILNGKVILTPGNINLDMQKPSLFDLTIYGMVQDGLTGEMLPNALVRVAGESRGVVTNKDGYFILNKVPTDTSTIEVSYLGYKRNYTKLTPVDSKRTLRISMAESTQKLAEFTVLNSRDNNTIRYGDDLSQISINPNNLSALPSLGELDIFRSLQLLPGISGTDETSSALNIRNSPSSHNLVLFDGFTIYRLDHFFGVFSAINPDAVRDIQVYKGGFGAEYGGRVSGVVDITGKTGNFNEPTFSLGLNLLSARMSVNAPLGNGKGAIHVSARRAYTDIIRSNLFQELYKNYRDNSNQVTTQQGAESNDDFLRPNFHFFDFNIKTTHMVSDRDVLSFSLYRGKDHLSTSFDQVQMANNTVISTETTDEEAEWSNTGVGAIWSRNWNSNFYSSLQLAYSSHNFDYYFLSENRDQGGDITNSYSADRQNKVGDLQVNYRNELKTGERHKTDFGLNFSAISTTNDVTIDQRPQRPTVERRQTGNVLALYGSHRYDVTKRFTINLGLRLSHTNLTSEDYLGRRIALFYQLSPSLKFKVSNGQYFQLARQVLYDDPRSNLQDGWNLADDQLLGSIEADHLIGGFNYSKNGWMVDIELYRKKVKGLLEFTVSHLIDPNAINDTQPIVTESMGHDDIKGMDLLIQKKIGPYQGWMSYTYSKSNSTYSGLNNGQTIPSRLDQRHELKFVNILEYPKFNISTTFLYGSGKPFYAPQLNFIRGNNNEVVNYEIDNRVKTIHRLPAYHRLDLSAAWKFENEEARGEIGISILNVYNHLNIQNRRLNVNSIERAISNGEEPQELYRNIVLLDFTPSVFFNIYF